MILDCFACDYETLARMAQIEQRAIARAEESGEFMHAEDARDYALAIEAMRRDDELKLQDFKDATFTRVLQITSQLAVTRGLTDAKRAKIQQAIDALIDAVK